MAHDNRAAELSVSNLDKLHELDDTTNVADVAVVEPAATPKDAQLWRDLVAYWILGLCNNYGYVVMLSAAHDIIASFGEEGNSGHMLTKRQAEPTRDCNIISTGAILLADIIPALCVKFLAPFLPFRVHIRIAICCLLAAAGFLLVAFAEAEWVAIMGVICTSLGSGFGEATFLPYSSVFNKNVISTWSSGTGGAGIIGSVSYAGLIAAGVSPTNTMLIMLIAPALEAFSFWVILRHPKVFVLPTKSSDDSIDSKPEDEEKPMSDEEAPLVGMSAKFKYIPSLLKYIVPLTLVYLFEYFINQGLFELVYFPDIWIDKAAQYRWLQVDYQIGVFISRSSVNIISFNKIWIMAALQFINVVFFLFEVIFFFSPSIWLLFAIVLWEGLLGGGAYVNTFYRMSQDIPKGRQNFALAVVTMSDSVGIALAGVFAIPSHNALCGLPVPDRLKLL